MPPVATRPSVVVTLLVFGSALLVAGASRLPGTGTPAFIGHPRLFRFGSFHAASALPVRYCTPTLLPRVVYAPLRLYSDRLGSASADVAETDLTAMKRDGGDDGTDDSSEFEVLLGALKMYRAAYGDLRVPSRFVVPSMPPWPEHAWGLKLGTRVSAVRTLGKYVDNDEGRRRALDDLGFLWRLRASGPAAVGDGIGFDQIYETLLEYQKREGNYEVPSSYVVPDIDAWPAQCRGLPLGKKLQGVRSKGYLRAHPEEEKKLLALGLELDSKTAQNNSRFKLVLSALQKYADIYGDLLVPQPFVIPEDDGWPEKLHGLRLGARVNAIRSQGTFVRNSPSRRAELDEIGFVWQPPLTSNGKKRGRKRKEDTVPFGPSLEASTPLSELAQFQAVPVGGATVAPGTATAGVAAPWEVEGEEEGPTVVVETSDEKERLVEMSLLESDPVFALLNEFDSHDFYHIIEATKLYYDKHGDFDIDEDFVVPVFDPDAAAAAAAALAAMEDGGIDGAEPPSPEEYAEEEARLLMSVDEWPAHLQGMRLGQITRRTREGDNTVAFDPVLREAYEDIDFEWRFDADEFLGVPFERFMCGLLVFHMVRSDLCVTWDYVVPDHDPWPRVLHGMELGRMTNVVRSKRKLLAEKYPRKKMMIDSLDFMWLPPKFE